jgi:hypothetical protein
MENGPSGGDLVANRWAELESTTTDCAYEENLLFDAQKVVKEQKSVVKGSEVQRLAAVKEAVTSVRSQIASGEIPEGDATWQVVQDLSGYIHGNAALEFAKTEEFRQRLVPGQVIYITEASKLLFLPKDEDCDFPPARPVLTDMTSEPESFNPEDWFGTGLDLSFRVLALNIGGELEANVISHDESVVGEDSIIEVLDQEARQALFLNPNMNNIIEKLRLVTRVADNYQALGLVEKAKDCRDKVDACVNEMLRDSDSYARLWALTWLRETESEAFQRVFDHYARRLVTGDPRVVSDESANFALDYVRAIDRKQVDGLAKNERNELIRATIKKLEARGQELKEQD